MAYSTDLKVRVIAYVEEGHTLAQKAAIFKVHPWSIIHWRKKYKATGNVENKVRRPVNKKIIPEKLLEYVKEHPDAYLKEIAELFGCCPSSVLKRLRKLRHHTKKNSTFYKEQNKQKIEHYLERIKDIPKEKRVYIDETGIDEQLYRRSARSPRGVSVTIGISGKRHKRTGVVAAHCKGKLIAPLTYDGTMKSQLFEKWFASTINAGQCAHYG